MLGMAWYTYRGWAKRARDVQGPREGGAARSIAASSSIDSGPGETRLVRRGPYATVFGLTDSGVGSAFQSCLSKRGGIERGARASSGQVSVEGARGRPVPPKGGALVTGQPRRRRARGKSDLASGGVLIGSAKISMREAEWRNPASHSKHWRARRDSKT